MSCISNKKKLSDTNITDSDELFTFALFYNRHGYGQRSDYVKILMCGWMIYKATLNKQQRVIFDYMHTNHITGCVY